jgi:Holliday junction resolvase RusA-like endonuclease
MQNTWRVEKNLRRVAHKELTANRVRDFTVELSFPDSKLMPNRSAGKHWTFNHGEKATQKQEAYFLARQAITESGFETNTGARYSVELLFHPPDNRKRDRDNLQAACKSMLDGIAQAMEINDAQFKPTSEIGETHYRGRVVVKVSEIR